MSRFSDLGASDRFDRGLFSAAEIFHENSKMRRDPGGRLLGLSPPMPNTSELNHALMHASKIYPLAPRTVLPKEIPAIALPFESVLRARSSVRDYSGSTISLTDLSSLLALSYGVIGETPLEDGVTLRPRRAAPSGGGLYPIELYPLLLRVKDVECGLYHYQPQGHFLERLRPGNLQGEIEHAVLYPEVVAQAGLVLLMGAVFHRHRFKYGERGYRFTLLDAGHVGQNVYLVSTALGLGAAAIGGYVDEETNRLVEMNGVDEAVVYVMAVGVPAGESADDPSNGESV